MTELVREYQNDMTSGTAADNVLTTGKLLYNTSQARGKIKLLEGLFSNQCCR
jgi:hypothetical protein